MSDDHSAEEKKLANDIVTEALLGNATAPERAAAFKTALLCLKLMRNMVPSSEAVQITLATLFKTGHAVVLPNEIKKLRDAIERTGFLKGRANEQPATRDLKDALTAIIRPR